MEDTEKDKRLSGGKAENNSEALFVRILWWVVQHRGHEDDFIHTKEGKIAIFTCKINL